MSIKFTNWLSRWQACNVKQLARGQRGVIISVTDPDKQEARLYEKAWEDVLRLKFHDKDFQPEGEPPYILFNEGHAKEVLNFLARHQDRVDCVITHCEAGISRSAAVAKFVAELYGLEFPESYMCYNKLVFSTLKRVWGEAVYSGEPVDFLIPGP